MNPAAWVEFPFTQSPTGRTTEDKNLRVQKAMAENLGPSTTFKLLPISAGTVPAATIVGNVTFPGVLTGDKDVSKDFDGFVKGIHIDITNPLNELDLLLSFNFSDNPFRTEKASVLTICPQTTGEKYTPVDYPTRRRARFFWKLENYNPTPVSFIFLLPFLEVRR